MRQFILVTGASSGIGEHTCKIVLQRGYEVIAGVRNSQDGSRLIEAYGNKLHPLFLDVTDQEGMEIGKSEAEKIIGNGSLVAVINNAGIVVNGAVLYIPIAEWRRQFEVNLLGVIRVTQIFFPLLSKPRSADDLHPRRIINISSVSGLFASPFLGPYVASKFALEAISDSLRRELYMYDIQVVLIEPGSIMTPMWEKAKKTVSYFGPEYDSILAFKEKIIDRSIAQGLPLSSLDKSLLRAVSSIPVKARYLIRPQKWKFNLIRVLPTKWVDRMIRKKLQKGSGIRPF